MKRLFALLVCMCVLVVGAGAEVHKDEIVYALLSPTGAVEGVYVVNGFEADGVQEVTDYGMYERVVNLSGGENLPYQEDRLTFTLNPGRFFYQGDLDAPILPWEIAIVYTLDGVSVPPDQLSGASGRLEMTLSAQPVPGMERFTAALTLQIMVTLDAGKCRNILAEKATTAWSGKNQTLAFVALPGASASYTITAEVTDFSMAGIQLAGVRMAMDAEMYKEMARARLEGSPLAEIAGNTITSFLGDMTNVPVVSFADARNTVRSLQFVLLTEEIPAKPAPEAEGENEGAGTPWTRLLALFRN